MNTNVRTSKGFWGLIGAIIIIIIILIASVQSGSGKSSVSEKKEVVKIGVISILSGQFGSFGEGYLNGVRLAEESWEKEHPNIDVQLVVEDDGFDAKKAVTAYKKLTSIDRVSGLLNTSTPSIDAIHADINAASLPTVQFGIQNVGVANDSIFQLSPAPDALLRTFGEYAKNHAAFGKIVTVRTKGEPFDTFNLGFVGGYGDKVAEKVLVNNSDINAVATDIARGDYNTVVIMAMPKEGALLIKKIQTLTKRPITYMIDAQLQTGKADYERILGSMKPLEGTYTIWFAAGDDKQFKQDYLAKYSAPAPMGADYGYDSFNTLMDAYDENAGVWSKNLQKTKSAGVSGGIAFDNVGQRIQDVQVMRVKNGEVKPIE